MPNPLSTELHDFLERLAARGIRLDARNGRLSCEVPRGALDDELRKTLQRLKEPIIEFLSRTQPTPGTTTVPALAEPAGTPVPLSFVQRRLWVESKLDAQNAAYNMRIALRIRGALERGLLQEALAMLVQRHAVLRTAFIERDGEAAQVVQEFVELPWRDLDLADRQPCARQEALTGELDRAGQTPFDLAIAPLLRVVLIKLEDREYVLLLTLHHLIGDGASLGIVSEELTELYSALAQRRPPQLPVLPVQYTDFARWQRETLDEDRLAALRQHWVSQLRNAPTSLALPTDRPHHSDGRRQGTTQTFTLSPALSASLRTRAREQGTTLFMTLLAGFAALMARYSNQDEVVIGCPISLRHHEELHPLVGMFVNSLAMRIRLPGDGTFADLLGHVRDVATDAYAHQDLPLDQVVEALRPPRSPLHHPLFQVMFIHDNAPTELHAVDGLSFEVLEHRNFEAKFDLMLAMADTSSGIRGTWEYRTDLFDADTIARATEHLRILLDAMALEPRQRVMQAPLMTETERWNALRSWGQGASTPPTPATLLTTFASRVESDPEAIAAECGDERWTFDQLDRASDAVAQRLMAQGIEAQSMVAVLMARRLPLLAALLGILKARCIYVPIDPNTPSKRLEFLLDDAQPRVLVLDEGTSSPPRTLPPTVSPLVVTHEVPRGPSPTHRWASIHATDVAYAIYTSGSTGAPKAVRVTHEGLYNYLDWAHRTYRLGPGTRAAVHTALAFDATVTTLWGPLFGGGTAVLVPHEEELSELARLLCASPGIDVVKCTPAHIDALSASLADPACAADTRLFVVGGEALLPRHVQWCRTVAPAATVVNEYGPTETVVGCCVYPLPPEAPIPDPIPIGEAIDNTSLWVLSEHLEPVPLGVPGELLIGGRGVAAGYHRRPELDAGRFIAHPFSTAPGARLYRTGDRVVRRPDGSLRFLGRVDNQIKLRGFRIELGEVEAALRQHPNVEQATVAIRQGAAGHARLVAYVVAPETMPSDESLREHLAGWLPEPMIPSAYVSLEALPLTANGKVDRAALPEPEQRLSAAVRAQTELESRLCALWSETLGIANVGINDDFFGLGGDSILGIQLVARAREQGLRFTPKDLLEHHTVEALARVVEVDARESRAYDRVTGPYPLTPIQHWFFARAMVRPSHFNHSIVLDVPADCDAQHLQDALDRLLEHHDVLRSRFHHDDNGFLASTVEQLSVRLEVVELGGLEPPLRSRQLRAHLAAEQAKLDLAAGPLLTATLYRMAETQPAHLLLTAHHLVVDAVSWRILVGDLVTLIVASAAGKERRLPGKSTPYAVWAERLLAWADTPAGESDRAYWLAQARRSSAECSPRPMETHKTAKPALVPSSFKLGLDHAETSALQEAAAMANADIQELLLAALTLTLHDPAQRELPVRVDVESHGREALFDELDLSRTVGWFTAIYPVFLAVDHSCDPIKTLRATKETMRAIPHRGVGFGIHRFVDPNQQRRAEFTSFDPASVVFNYFGRIGVAEAVEAGFRLSAIDCPALHDPRTPRLYALDINAGIRDGALEIEWGYCPRTLSSTAIEALAESFMTTLGVLRHACIRAQGSPYSPSDFPDVELSQESLEQLLGQLSTTARNHE